MFKYNLSALARLLVYHALAIVFLQGLLSAQVTLPPIIGDTMWTYDTKDKKDVSPTDSPRGPWHDYAEDAGVVFRMTVSDIIVMDANTGEIKDRLGLRELLRGNDAEEVYYETSSVQCDRYGKRLVIRYKVISLDSRIGDTLVSMMVSYPERRVLKSIKYLGWVEYFYDYHTAISPDGRWMAAPHNPIEGKSYVLYDSERDTSHIINLGGTSLWSFDSSSSQAAFSNVIIDLQSGTPKVRSFPSAKGLSLPMFSADGRYIIGRTTTRSGLSQYPRVSILDIKTGEIVWQLHGSWEWTGGNGNMRDDLLSFAISGNGRLVYAYRNDTINGKVIDEGFFYRPPDTIPIARSMPRTTGGFAPGYIALDSDHAGYLQFSRDLTRCFVAARSQNLLAYPGYLVAMRFDELVTGIPQGGATNTQQTALYPNPTTGVVTVRWEWPDETVHWQVVSATGQLVDYGSAMREGSDVRIVLAGDLASGNYSLLLRDVLAEHVRQFNMVKN
jgi:hypothetical protein